MTDNGRVRVSIVGVVIVALFCALLARLWFLQVAADGDLKIEAVSRSTRVVQTEMPRGRILDRNGVELVVNRVSWAITVDRTLDEDERQVVVGQLAELLGVPSEQLAARFDDVQQSQLKPAILAVDVSEPVRTAILEHIEDYPGTNVERLTVRKYPQELSNGMPLASHVLGYVGEISEEQLATRREAGYEPGDTIGRAGVERAYERWLRGEPRRETMEVDPTGRPVGSPISAEPGQLGNDVYLTIDAGWQRAAEESLMQGLEAARTLKNENIANQRFETLKAPAGAVVVLDATDGSVAALASFPQYDPRQFIDGITQAEWSSLNDDPARHKPLLNRATQGAYDPGSTFKLVSALAMTDYGIRGAGEAYDDRGFVEIRGTDYQNAGRHALGRVDLMSALAESSDTYFYTVGWEFWKIWDAGDVDRGLGLQRTARDLGLGAKTGIELDEAAGTIPDPDSLRALAEAIHESEADQEAYSIWYPYHQIYAAIGQGVTVTPLQLANAYAAFANGGTLFQPRLGFDVRDVDGETVETPAAEVAREIAFDSYVRSQMLAGFANAVQDDSGTASNAFRGFPLDEIPVSGKTGTAQVGLRAEGRGDTSLFAAYFPARGRQYVAVAIVEEGGRGAQVAAPIVRRVIESMNGIVSLEPLEVLEDARD